VIATGFWLPLLGLFISHGISRLLQCIGTDALPYWLALLMPRRPNKNNGDRTERETILLAFYSRIVLMQLSILFDGIVAIALGAIGPLILLIGLKTAVDLALHFKLDFDGSGQPSAAASTMRRKG
jgi:hypothetical protein